MDPRERLEEGRTRRWVILFLLLLILAAFGAGIGGFVVDFDAPDDEPSLSIDVNPDLTPVDTSTTPAPAGSPTDSDGDATPGTPTVTDTPTTAPTTPETPVGTTPTATTPSPTTTSPPSGTPPTPPQTTTTSGTTTQTTTTSTPTTTTPTTTTPPGDDSLDLEFEGNTVIFDYQHVKPGEGGTETIVLSNTGGVTGNLSVENITAVDAENGLVDPEEDVDDTPTEGELSEHLRVAMSVTYPDGTTLWVFGTGHGPRILADLAAIETRSASRPLAPGEEATVTVEWLLPSSTGNVVQSDEVSVDVVFALRAEES